MWFVNCFMFIWSIEILLELKLKLFYVLRLILGFCCCQALHCSVDQRSEVCWIRHRHQEHVRVLGLGRRPLLSLVSFIVFRKRISQIIFFTSDLNHYYIQQLEQRSLTQIFFFDFAQVRHRHVHRRSRWLRQLRETSGRSSLHGSAFLQRPSR